MWLSVLLTCMHARIVRQASPWPSPATARRSLPSLLSRHFPWSFHYRSYIHLRYLLFRCKHLLFYTSIVAPPRAVDYTSLAGPICWLAGCSRLAWA